MQVILTSPKGKRYMVRPASTGLDYEVLVENPGYGKPKTKGKNKGEINNEEWKSLGKWASTLWFALNIALEDMMRDQEDRIVITANKGSLEAQLIGIKQCFTQYLDRITMEVKNGN